MSSSAEEYIEPPRIPKKHKKIERAIIDAVAGYDPEYGSSYQVAIEVYQEIKDLLK